MNIKIKVPATTANLGPGFDALGLALNLWNETVFEAAQEFTVSVTGEGADSLPMNERNLIVRAAGRLADSVHKSLPAFRVKCINRIPLESGMGSSAAAIITGLLAANTLLELKLSNEDILNLAAEMEGHPDNVAPALLGGLVAATVIDGRAIARKLPTQHFAVTIVLPEFIFPTKKARSVLPEQVTMKDAVHNISRAVLVTRALEDGDFELLSQVMTDVLHQPYRLPLIPGAKEAMDAARKAGAAAVVLSGAGPSLAAFSSRQDPAVGEAMTRAFKEAGLSARIFQLDVSEHGAEIQK